jgi:O-antigen ligase
MQLNAIRGMSVERQVQYDTIIKLLILVKVAVKQPERYFPFTMPFVVTLLYKAVTLVVVMHVAIRVCVFQDWRKVPAFPVIALFSVLAFCALLVHHRRMDISFTMASYCILHLFVFCMIPLSFPQELVEREMHVLMMGLVGIGIVGLVPALYGVLFLGTGAPMPETWKAVGGYLFLQENPNRLGPSFLILGVISWAYFLLACKTKRWIAVVWLALFVASFRVLLSLGSRASFFLLLAGCFAYLCLLFLCYARSRSRKVFLVSFAIVLAACGLFLLIIFGGQKLFNPQTSHLGKSLFDTSQRSKIWKETISLIRERPWFGWTSWEIMQQRADVVPVMMNASVSPHNSFFDIALFLGIPASFLFSGLILYVLLRSFLVSLQGEKGPFVDAFFWLTVSLLAVSLLHGMVETSLLWHSFSISYAFYISMGYLLYLFGRSKQCEGYPSGNC